MDVYEATNAPEGLIDFAGELKPEPVDYVPATFGPRDAEAVKSLFYMRKCVDPIDGLEFEGAEMKDFFKFGWYPTNLGVTIGKKKTVGSFELDAGLLCPFIGPKSLFAAADHREWHHSSFYFIKTMRTEKEPVKLPTYLKEWHKDDLKKLKDRFRGAHDWLEKRAPAGKKKEYSALIGNRHPRAVQRAHHLSALTWQLMQGFEKSKGFAARELDAWCYVLAFELLYADAANGVSFDRDLATFIVRRMKDIITLDRFGDLGFQTYYARYVFILFWLGQPEEAWNAACEISKVRGAEFNKSPTYECIVDMREKPTMMSDMLAADPKAVLTYFRI